ncbi:hypothetical protein Tco_0632359 [Tanacetum coccineum]
MVVKGEVLNNCPGFFGVEVTKFTTGRLVNGSSCDGVEMVLKDFDLEPKDIVAKFCCPSRWKELSKESGGGGAKNLLYGSRGTRYEKFYNSLEKEQQDKLKAAKARLLYEDESGKNPRGHEKSHYSKSKTPTARAEPRRRHGNRRSQSPSPIASVFKRLKRNRLPSPRLRPRKEGGVFNRLGGKEQSASARSDSHHQSSHTKGTEVQPRRHHHRGTSSRETNKYSESEDNKGGHWKSKTKRHRSNTYEDDLSQPWTCEERNPFTPRI